jgi:methylthioribulose-1-phosphate dehydratase
MSLSRQALASEAATRALICELCRNFYTLGWVSGTGGGVSIVDQTSGRVLVAPSGVQKERIQPEDLFALDPKDQTCILEHPTTAGGDPAPYKQSECTPLFYNAFTLRGAGACIHTHSKAAVLATMLVEGNEFRISHVEMIKGIRDAQTGLAHRFDQTLVVPIIENTNFERELTESMADAMQRYPSTHCVMVRRHGVYIWGATWQQAKAMAECYDYLFAMYVDMKAHGLPTVKDAPAAASN